MEMVYGGAPDIKAFIDQVYLVTLVKLIVYFKLSGAKYVKDEEIEEIVDGSSFRKQAILNLIEEDFFAWILLPSIKNKTIELVKKLAKEVLYYDLTQVDEDLFKEIYQEIVARGERHKVGEYYTPEWLCDLTLSWAYQEWKKGNTGIPRIIDPACGSGTFLTNAIRLLKEELNASGVPPAKIGDTILENVMGVDINPVAVVIARANYLIMLGDLWVGGKYFNITVPIYVADAIKTPDEEKTKVHGVEVCTVKARGRLLYIPLRVAIDRALFGQVIGGFREGLREFKLRKNKTEAYKALERWVEKQVSTDELRVLNSTLETLIELVNEDLDTIWMFILNNTYAPLAMKENKFDMIVGNPPWIAMKDLGNKEYKDFLKESVFRYGLLEKKEVKLFPHLEIATLFFCKVSDLYLKENGVIGFVMPRSILTGALHHTKFRLFKTPLNKLVKILDVKEVSPLFGVPSCSIICAHGTKTSYPVSATKYSGKLEKKNERLPNVMKMLKTAEYSYEPPNVSGRYSAYHDDVQEGATIVPRRVWFVEFDVSPRGWVDLRKPTVKSSSKVENKIPWSDVNLKGNVERDFIYTTLLGGDIVSFGFSEFRSVVLPIEPAVSEYKMMDIEALNSRAFFGMADWLEKAQQIWDKKATEKAKKNNPRIISWINYRNKIQNQNPKTKYLVLYNASATNLVSCVLNKHELLPFRVGKDEIKPAGFVVESKTYFYATDDEDESHYLCAFLNSNVLNKAIKPHQTEGLYGERDIHRRPFWFNIPKFNKDDSLHVKLTELSKKCHFKVCQLQLKEQSAASARKKARQAIEEELKEIDNIVSEILRL